MRTTHELLKVVLEKFEKGQYVGICCCAYSIYGDIITCEEYEKIIFYIRSNKPAQLNYSDYWWEKWLKPPRIAWLKEHIEKTKELE